MWQNELFFQLNEPMFKVGPLTRKKNIKIVFLRWDILCPLVSCYIKQACTSVFELQMRRFPLVSELARASEVVFASKEFSNKPKAGIVLPHSPANFFQLFFRVSYVQRRSAVVAKFLKISPLRHSHSEAGSWKKRKRKHRKTWFLSSCFQHVKQSKLMKQILVLKQICTSSCKCKK